MSSKIAFDKASIDGKVLVDDDKLLGYPTIIASEIVQQYEDGYAYKPAEDLEQMAQTANLIGARPVKILEHPGADTNYLLLKRSDVHGIVKNFQFVKNLIDTKTKRPCRRGVKADVYWFKDRVPKETIDDIRSGKMLDVSIGFTFDREDTSGEFEGQHYDYIQRNLFLDHLAAPIPSGRCPGPICGIGYDSSMIQFDAKILTDCPVCAHMREVGWSEAGKRLYTAYGPDVLEVIDTGYIPQLPKPPKTSIDEKFNKAIKTLEQNLSQSQKD
jgi:hypothetical protein